ncbi:MAG: helix-turn-helix transcriptional regulator [bacterium]|nr:helix-turn-helix transcriptional regulator [bacterium]
MDFDERIRHDTALVAGDPEAAALLECLARHAFDPAHDLASMLRACGAARPVQERLAAKLGALKKWHTELRMEEARRRVCDTSEEIGKIGQAVGYAVDRTFRRAFADYHGESPSKMRRKARAGGPASQSEPAADDESEVESGDTRPTPRALTADLRRRASLGLLDPGRAAELRPRLRRRHRCLDETGDSTHPQYPVILTPTGDHVEDFAAAAALGELLDAPEDEMRFALLHGVLFGNAGSYHYLQKTCRGMIPHRPEQALLLAELAVQMIQPHRDLMGEEADDWQALAWTFLGEVQAHLGHGGEAERSLAFACAEVDGAEHLAPWVEIELRRVQGRVARRQRRYDRAAKALDRALELGRRLSETSTIRGQAVLHRLELASTMGDAETGLALARELGQLVEADEAETGERLTLWRALALYHHARALAAADQECCAGAGMQQVLDEIAEDPECDTDTSLGMLFTLALHERARHCFRHGRPDDCERDLRFALERYRWFEAVVFEAAVEAELAVLCALRGEHDEARRLASAAAAFLDDLPFHREAWNAARRLRALIDGDADTEVDLEALLAELWRDLDLVAWEITGTQALPAARARREQT